MKNLILTTTLSLLLTALAQADPTPAFAINFNSDSALRYENNAAQGPAGSGVSGQVTDRAYIAAVTSPDPTIPQPGAVVADIPLAEMSKLTLTFWYKTSSLVQNASLLNLGGVYLIWDGPSGWTARLSGKSPNTFGNWLRIGTKGPVAPWTSDGEWVFGAITWNLETKTATIYQGSKSSMVAVQRVLQDVAIIEPVNGGTIGIIGNSPAPKSNPPMPSDRPFNGSIDNISVFDTELDQAAIEAIRAAALENKAP